MHPSLTVGEVRACKPSSGSPPLSIFLMIILSLNLLSFYCVLLFFLICDCEGSLARTTVAYEKVFISTSMFVAWLSSYKLAEKKLCSETPFQ